MNHTEEIDIIYWTKWFGGNQWEDYKIDQCNLPYTCKMTHDRTKAVNSSVIVFHASDLDNLKDMPEQVDDRAWVYHNAEAPKDTPDILDVMQYSMTYRLDSDFPWGYLDQSQLLSSLERPLVKEKNKTKEEGAHVAWIVSNCKATNDRHLYVKELSKYIDIDIYGHCLNNKEFPENTTTIDLISKYDFYLSIENSNCKDYVTEKLSNAFLAGTVPIVDGPSDYRPFIPDTHSVIRIDGFETPNDLADYLKKLIKDKELYEAYVSYRRPGGLSKEFKNTLEIYKQGVCGLCTLAYERHTNMSNYYPGKKIYLDNTCVSHKHKHFGYSDTLMLYIPVMVVTLAISYFLVKLFRSRFYGWLGYKRTAAADE
ncbi:hypothetical protein BD770DRAFT_390842 [Pilaira anomala]|nr:hypothetical protein BD770DRAFT_390842 [Pilaira anomala]